ncbi:MAG: hypothetical protein IT448_02140 [Phycisphaerales bacterium]|nr:hypothetical protein [Phycisphaerales bacterium]
MMISRSFKCLLAVTLVSSAALFIAPARAQAAEDLSTPKAALKTLFQAATSGDKQTVKDAVSGTEMELKVADVMVDMITEMKALNEAAKAKFGQIPDDFDDVSKLAGLVDQATVVETGDTAVISVPPPPRPEGAPKLTDEEAAAQAKANELKMVRVNGQWKLDISSMTQGEPLTDQHVQQFTAMAKAAKETTTEIKEGKHASYDAAMQAFGMKMMSAMMGGAMPPASEDEAGAPATEPAPAPAQ